MSRRAATTALSDALTAAARAMSSGRRAEIVDVLAQGARPVEEITGESGRRARRLDDGFPEWKRAGLPVAVGEGRQP